MSFKETYTYQVFNRIYLKKREFCKDLMFDLTCSTCVVKEGVKLISKGIFEGMSTLTSITFPTTLEMIEEKLN